MKKLFLLLVVMMLSSVITVNGQNNTRRTASKAGTASKARSTAPKSKNKVYKVGNVSFTMVYVEGGDCVLGRTSDQGTPRRGFNDDPADCYLSSFYIGQTVVTEELWTAVMEEPYSEKNEKNYPVCPSWDNCQIFIAKLNAKTGENFRMPTEWEWEYAARGGNKSKYTKYAGSNILSEVGYEDSGSHPVGTKKPNELGIYEMSGTPSEWCQNYYYKLLIGGKNPRTNSHDGTRSVRGISVISHRYNADPTYGHHAFRLLRPIKRIVIEEDD